MQQTDDDYATNESGVQDANKTVMVSCRKKSNGIELSIMPKGKQAHQTEQYGAASMNHEQSKFNTDVGIKVGILGYGNYGKAFGERLDAIGMRYSVGSRSPSRWNNSCINIMSYQEMIERSEVIILAINVKNYATVVTPLRDALANKIIVDVSNADKLTDPCNATQLATLLPRSNIVKAFNTISAYTMQNDLYGANRNVYVCADDETNRKIIMQLAQELGFTPVERGRLRAANVLEKIPLQLFPAWRNALWMTLGLLVFQTMYYLMREFMSTDPLKVARHLALYHANRITCWMALWLLSLVYLPGCIAGFLQLYRGTKYSRFPHWLDEWMKSRKQLGLIGLCFAGMHACLSCLALGTGYVKYMSKVVNIPGTKQYVYHQINWNAEISLLFAVLAMTLFIILGITSLPSVNQTMTWKEWDLVQSKLGHVALLFSFLHVTVYTYSVFDPRSFSRWVYNIPPAVFLQPIVPCVVLLLKFILLMPGVRGRLQRIRNGWEKRRADDSEQSV